jgi:hypothetical protein
MVADRVAQEVVRRYLEPILEPVFHPDSYGYRPGKSAIDPRLGADAQGGPPTYALSLGTALQALAEGSSPGSDII